MRNALHEQLLKAGLIDEQRLEEAEREKRREQRPQAAKGPAPHRKHGKHGKRKDRAEPVRRQGLAPAVAARSADAESARQAAQAARRELEREIVQVIKANRRPHNDGEEVYNFIDGRKVARIYVTAETHAQLSRGELAIVRLRTRYAVVPTETANGIAAKAPELVLVANRTGGGDVDDPAYAEHPVPDDLRW